MRVAGVVARLEIWPRMPHVFQSFSSILPEARRAIRHIGAFVRAHARS
jgi:acetyl esterase/lipase